VGFVLPEFVGHSLGDASAAIASLGLVAEVQRVPSDSPPNTVIGQQPAAGTPVAAGSHVVLRVSRGADVPVPNVVGQRLDAVRGQLEALTFTLLVREKKSQRPGGTILDQSPEPGSRVPPGTTITLTVAR